MRAAQKLRLLAWQTARNTSKAILLLQVLAYILKPHIDRPNR
jgi:hypothetical protein